MKTQQRDLSFLGQLSGSERNGWAKLDSHLDDEA
jgi:hypothetical protein